MLSKNLALCLIITLLFGSALASSISAAVSYEKEELVSSTIKKWQPKISANEFPSHQPSIESGKEVYKMNCAMCHGHEPNEVLTKDQLRSKSPEEQYIIIKNGNAKGMPAFKNKLSRDEMWDALMYVRAGVLGYYPLNSDELAKMNAIFGGNCAVCHGTRGHGDGPLHKSLNPMPANFNMFQRLYTRSDNRLHKELTHGIPWTAMPAWKNRVDFNQNYKFDDEMIWKLVTYVRQFGFSQEIDRLDIGRQKLKDYEKSIGKGK
jgi:mono/diheme cytochrome c family protein